MPERRCDGLSGRRTTKREQVVLAASAWAIGGSRSVLVADISAAGAKLRGRDLPQAATELLMTVGTAELFATVNWSHDDECGLSFEVPLTPQQIAQISAQGDWGLVKGFR